MLVCLSVCLCQLVIGAEVHSHFFPITFLLLSLLSLSFGLIDSHPIQIILLLLLPPKARKEMRGQRSQECFSKCFDYSISLAIADQPLAP